MSCVVVVLQDQLATEVYTFVARESDIGQYLLEVSGFI